MMSDTVFGLLSAKRSLIGVLLGSAKSFARLRLRQRRFPEPVQIATRNLIVATRLLGSTEGRMSPISRCAMRRVSSISHYVSLSALRADVTPPTMEQANRLPDWSRLR